MQRLLSLLLALSCAVSSLFASGGTGRPGLLWSPEELAEARASLGREPLFDAALQEARELVARALSQPIDVPKPLDAAGYTHERHKLNYREMHAAGLLFRLTGDARLVAFVRAQLLAYAELYPTLGNHPAGTGHSPGRIFWQTLNECVWLVNVSQAYDFVHDELSPADRELIEARLLRPLCRFFVEERVRELDRMHNHGTWTVTAVALAGLAMGDDTLVDKALLGSKRDGKAGFLRQLDALYSPDGLYCEGPYYGRYAILPFYLLGRVLEHRRPGLKVFALRDGLLLKALHVQLQLTDANGAFLPYNDALKEKSHRSPEILFALAEVHAHHGQDASLLDVARRQGAVALSPAGLRLARALSAAGSPAAAPAYPYSSLEYKDGPDGGSGGVGVLRAAPAPGGAPRTGLLLCMKYGVHGMEHGHYDKLSFQLHDQGLELLPDYGSARFLNIDQKTGGRYLPENKSWAMQTVAHNTVVVDQRSQFDGKYDASEASHSERHFFQASDPRFQVVSAREDKAYAGVSMLRTMAVVSDPRLSSPIVVDLYRLRSAASHTYDYALNYAGQFLATNATLQKHTTQRSPLGTAHGYQHLWLEAEGPVAGDQLQFTWFNGNRFYTVTSAAGADSRLLMHSLGANDPSFNLRRQTGLIHRRQGSNLCFATVIEPHGVWDGNKEFCQGNTPSVTRVEVLHSDDTSTVVRVSAKGGLSWTLLLNAGPASDTATHQVQAAGETFEWVGNAALLSR